MHHTCRFLYPQIAHGGVIREEFMWLPSLGLNFVLRMDGFAWLFSMLVLGSSYSQLNSEKSVVSPKGTVGKGNLYDPTDRKSVV